MDPATVRNERRTRAVKKSGSFSIQVSLFLCGQKWIMTVFHFYPVLANCQSVILT